MIEGVRPVKSESTSEGVHMASGWGEEKKKVKSEI